jgi:hypothetical protein
MCMEMFLKAQKTNTQISLGVVLGDGIEVDGNKYWFDGDGKPYDLLALKALGIKKNMRWRLFQNSCTGL